MVLRAVSHSIISLNIKTQCIKYPSFYVITTINIKKATNLLRMEQKLHLNKVLR